MTYFVEILLDSGVWDWVDCSIFVDLDKAKSYARALARQTRGHTRVIDSTGVEHRL